MEIVQPGNSGSSGGGITIGTTSITGGVSGRLLFDNAGVVGETATPTVTTLNKVTITAPTTSATLTLVQGSSLITAGAFPLTLTSTAASNATIPAGTNTLYSTRANSITSAQLATSLTNETGTGSVVFSTSPQIASPVFTGFVSMDSLEMNSTLYEFQGADATAASNTILSGGNYYNIVGTPGTEIDFFTLAGAQPGMHITVYFQDTFVIGNSAGSITLPLWIIGTNITTEAYDIAKFVLDVNFAWVLESYVRYDGTPLQPSQNPSGVVAGTYGDGNDIPVITVAANGLVTAATTVKPTLLNPLPFQTSNYNFLSGDFIGFTVSSMGSLIGTLPTGVPIGTTCGAILFGVTTNGNTLTIVPSGGDTINQTGTSLVLSQLGQSVTLTSDGLGAWFVTASAPGQGGAPCVLASNDLMAQTATVSSVVTLTPVGNTSPHTYEIGAYAAVTAISAGTVTITATYTDENGVSVTKTFGALTSISSSSFSPIVIRARDAQAITIVATFSGVSIAYDVGGYIKQVY